LYPGFGGVESGTRFYDPSLQRWINHDPQGESGGINLWQFCGGDPINRVDTDGNYSYTPWRNAILDELSPDLKYAARKIDENLKLGLPDNAAGFADKLYLGIAAGGKYIEPLAADLMRNWLNGKNDNVFQSTYLLSSSIVKAAILDVKHNDSSTSPSTQLASQLCPDVSAQMNSIGLFTEDNPKIIDLSASAGEYFHALGGFQVKFVGSYIFKDQHGFYRGQFTLKDRYDWHADPALKVELPGVTVKDIWATLVEDYYGARPFDVTGTWTGVLELDCTSTPVIIKATDKR
jgi:hypothetical protein